MTMTTKQLQGFLYGIATPYSDHYGYKIAQKPETLEDLDAQE